MGKKFSKRKKTFKDGDIQTNKSKESSRQASVFVSVEDGEELSRFTSGQL